MGICRLVQVREFLIVCLEILTGIRLSKGGVDKISTRTLRKSDIPIPTQVQMDTRILLNIFHD